jgi:PAS domain S-box-containing protein
METAPVSYLEIETDSPGMRILVIAACLIVIFLAGIALIGWISGWRLLASISPQYFPMAPSTAVCFLVMGVTWLFPPQKGASLTRLVTCISGTVLVMAFNLLDVLEWLGLMALHIEDLVLPEPALFHGVPLARVSPLSSGLFVLTSGAMLVHFLRTALVKEHGFLGHLSGLLASSVVFSGFTLLLGYLYGTPLLYGREIIPVAASTSTAFLFMGLALAARLKPYDTPKRYFAGPLVNHRLARVFVPLVFFAALLQGIVGRLAGVFLEVNDALLSALIAGSIAVLGMIVTSKAASVVGSDIDRANQALRESEERFRMLIQSAGSTIIGLNVDFQITEFNNQAEKLFGRQRQEVLGKNCLEFFVRDEARKIMADEAREVLSGRPTAEFENLVVTPNGEKRILFWNINRLKATDPQRTMLLAAGMDVTDLKKAEEALRESEQRFRAMFENHHAVMLIIDPETGQIEDGSPGACSFYGYSREDLREKKITEINVLTSSQVFENMQLAEGGQRKYFDFRHRLASGEIRDVEVCSGPVTVGGRTLLLSVINDVTERKRAEKALAESEERYRIVADFAYDWEYWISPGRQFVYVSPSCEKITGYSSDEFHNDPDLFLSIIYPDDRALVMRHMDDAFQPDDTTPHSIDFRILRKDGELRWINHVCKAAYSDTGEPLGRRGSHRDISDRKRLEQEQQELVVELQNALAQVKNLSGLLPICASCKKIRDDKGYWQQIEAYIRDHSEAEFSHSICPDCVKKLYPEFHEE